MTGRTVLSVVVVAAGLALAAGAWFGFVAALAWWMSW